ncbi:4-hydroxy-3-polyprenylbenzoate decarboxylase [Orbus hercynius]|uniref:Flavin prenyltransferase UbiX n=1 Tax=Orbus hercynius TaxID=593135 RepID=A0A495RB75_9GAMM|nr:UbiX family flavin prenyltransferase [Orbus hercynius]RKS84732.1 4-hydroxy-3-polyprenylbenzoate decarboxylase [Orbus hercynius]
MLDSNISADNRQSIAKRRLIVGISGASGALYGIRLLELLAQQPNIETHLVISHSAKRTIDLETDYEYDNVIAMADHYYDIGDIAANISSGSFRTDGMIIVPCSIKTLSGIANSYSDNLLIRAADVVLKEQRRLVLCVRETPLHLGHIQLMQTACQIGATIMPLVPAFYHKPNSVEQLVDQSLTRVLDQFNIANHFNYGWRHD